MITKHIIKEKFRKNINQMIIYWCYLLNKPFPVKIQKQIFATARLHMHRFTGMCQAINEAVYLLYECDFCYPKNIPIFSKTNFQKVTGLEPQLFYWTKRSDKYNRLKFLKWCEENVDKQD